MAIRVVRLSVLAVLAALALLATLVFERPGRAQNKQPEPAPEPLAVWWQVPSRARMDAALAPISSTPADWFVELARLRQFCIGAPMSGGARFEGTGADPGICGLLAAPFTSTLYQPYLWPAVDQQFLGLVVVANSGPEAVRLLSRLQAYPPRLSTFMSVLEQKRVDGASNEPMLKAMVDVASLGRGYMELALFACLARKRLTPLELATHVRANPDLIASNGDLLGLCDALAKVPGDDPKVAVEHVRSVAPLVACSSKDLAGSLVSCICPAVALRVPLHPCLVPVGLVPALQMIKEGRNDFALGRCVALQLTFARGCNDEPWRAALMEAFGTCRRLPLFLLLMERNTASWPSSYRLRLQRYLYNEGIPLHTYPTLPITEATLAEAGDEAGQLLRICGYQDELRGLQPREGLVSKLGDKHIESKEYLAARAEARDVRSKKQSGGVLHELLIAARETKLYEHPASWLEELEDRLSSMPKDFQLDRTQSRDWAFLVCLQVAAVAGSQAAVTAAKHIEQRFPGALEGGYFGAMLGD